MKNLLFLLSILLILLQTSCTGNATKSNIDTILEKFQDANFEYIRVAAHRSAHKEYPENSISAINMFHPELIHIYPSFLRLEAKENKHITLFGKDLSLAKTPFNFDKGASSNCLYESDNRIK